MAAETLSTPAHLDPSPLGTKQYWDTTYQTSLSHLTTTASTSTSASPETPPPRPLPLSELESQTTWFAESSCTPKLLTHLARLVTTPSPCSLALSKATTTFLDLGCGSGATLFALREARWTGRMLGVDYSAVSIELSRRLALERGLGITPPRISKQRDDEGTATRYEMEEGKGVEFQRWDIMTEPVEEVRRGAQADGWDLVLDKGTFDAVSLSEEAAKGGLRHYVNVTRRLVKKGGRVVVTSCNWTEEEIRRWFEEGSEGEGTLVYEGRIEYRKFRFGGGEGSSVCTVVFLKI